MSSDDSSAGDVTAAPRPDPVEHVFTPGTEPEKTEKKSRRSKPKYEPFVW